MHNIIISIKKVYLKSSDVLFFSFRFMIIIIFRKYVYGENSVASRTVFGEPGSRFEQQLNRPIGLHLDKV